MAGQLGFDEGALFDTLSKPKYTIETFKYDSEGRVKSKHTKVVSYWDTVMAVGGPALIFGIVAIIKRLSTIAPDWFDEKEQNWIKEHPAAFLALGPIGFKLICKKADGLNLLDNLDKMIGVQGWIAQMKENWGVTDGDRGGLDIQSVDTTALSWDEERAAKDKRIADELKAASERAVREAAEQAAEATRRAKEFLEQQQREAEARRREALDYYNLLIEEGISPGRAQEMVDARYN